MVFNFMQLVSCFASPMARDLAVKSDNWFAKSGATTSGDWTTNPVALELDFAPTYLSTRASILHFVCMAMFSDVPFVDLND